MNEDVFKLSRFCQERFIQELCCASFATVSTGWPYSSLRTSSHALVWDPGSTESGDETTIAFTVAHDLTLGFCFYVGLFAIQSPA